MYTRKTLVKTKDQCWGVISIFLISSSSDFWEIWISKNLWSRCLRNFESKRWVLFFSKFENQRMSGFDLLNNFRTSRSSFSKKPQRTEGLHKIISSFIEGYPTNSEIFLRTVLIYENQFSDFENHSCVSETGYLDLCQPWLYPWEPPWEPPVIIFHFWQPPNTGKDLFPLGLVSGVS